MAIAPSDNNNSSTNTNTPGASTSKQSQITLSENKKLVNEMVGGCSVCSDDQGTEENPLVYCDGCEVAVHQACYGIINVPSGSWFCRKCESGDGHSKIKCELCPSKDGALKRTETGQWAHVVCALYIPEVRFGNNNTMEPIEIKHIHAERYAKSCYLCEKAGNLTTANYGAVMDCHKLGCKQSFHVTCAQMAGLLFEEADQRLDNLNYCGYCKHHFRKLKSSTGGNGNSSSSSSGGAGKKTTGQNKTSYNSASSYSDSASDSSQDNDSRCNTTTLDYDKTNRKNNNNNSNEQTILPTNLSINVGLNDFSKTATTSLSQLNTASIVGGSGGKILGLSAPTNGPISLTIPLNNNPSNKNTISPSSSSTSSVNKDGTTKRKRAPKSNSSSNNSSIDNIASNQSPSSTLPTASILSNPLSSSTIINPLNQPNSSNIITNHGNSINEVGSNSQLRDADAQNWANSSSSTINATNNKNINSNNKKKQTTTISSSTQAKQQQALVSNTANYNLNKIDSPNLSISTSPSLASPSNSSAKSTSNSSSSSITTTTTTSSCSSSSTTSSPSPALLSPNITNSQRGSTVRIESPLASKSKTGTNNYNKSTTLPESVVTSNIASSSTTTTSTTSPDNLVSSQNNNPKGTRANSNKNDLSKKNPLVGASSASLLSTALPTTNDHLLAGVGQSTIRTDITVSTSTIQQQADFSSGLAGGNILQAASSSTGPSKDSSSTIVTNSTQPNLLTNINNTLPSVPPLIIPVQQSSASSSCNNSNLNTNSKTTAKTSKTGAKGTRKKSTENSESTTTPKPEPKPKSSRATKKNANANSNSNSIEQSPSKLETPKRGKARAAKQNNNNKYNNSSEQLTGNTTTSSTSAAATTTTTTTTIANSSTKRQSSASSSPSKRKSRSTSNESTASNTATAAAILPSPPKRQRKKKTDQQQPVLTTSQTNDSITSTNTLNSIKQPNQLNPMNTQQHFLSIRPPSNSNSVPLGSNPLMVNTPIPNSRLLSQGFNSIDGTNHGDNNLGNNKYFSPMISPYANYDHLSASSLSRASLSRLFTASSVDINTNNNNLLEDPAKAFDELRENTWSHLSRCILEQAQQFDIPSLIGTLYTLRSENEKLVNRVRELTMKRDQLIAMNARLDLPGPLLTQHLSNTSPNFSSVVSGLTTNSPRSLPASSPGSAITGGSKQAHIQQASTLPPSSTSSNNPLASFNLIQQSGGNNNLIPPGFSLDSNSPLIGHTSTTSTTHSGLNNIKTSSISTPSPPISALMAHSNSNRAGLITINSPFMPNVFPPINTLAQLGTTPQSSSYYSRQ